jgi:hypothetical protein
MNIKTPWLFNIRESREEFPTRSERQENASFITTGCRKATCNSGAADQEEVLGSSPEEGPGVVVVASFRRLLLPVATQRLVDCVGPV